MVLGQLLYVEGVYRDMCMCQLELHYVESFILYKYKYVSVYIIKWLLSGFVSFQIHLNHTFPSLPRPHTSFLFPMMAVGGHSWHTSRDRMNTLNNIYCGWREQNQFPACFLYIPKEHKGPRVVKKHVLFLLFASIFFFYFLGCLREAALHHKVRPTTWIDPFKIWIIIATHLLLINIIHMLNFNVLPFTVKHLMYIVVPR